MRRSQLEQITKRLDDIIKLLEMQTIVPEDAQPVCLHEHAKDMGVMGDRPGEHMFCQDCRTEFSRIKEN